MGVLRASLTLAILAVLAGPARAEFLEPQGGKLGPYMLNLKIGPSVPYYGTYGFRETLVSLNMQVEFAIAVDRNRNVYIGIPIQVQVERERYPFPYPGYQIFYHVKLIFPLSIQADIPIPAVPGLYYYPRLSAGYVLYIDDRHGGAVIPEIGLKYVLRQRLNFGIEPLSLPMLFYRENNTTMVRLEYRALVYVGMNFR